MKYLVKMFYTDIETEKWINQNTEEYDLYQVIVCNGPILVIMKKVMH